MPAVTGVSLRAYNVGFGNCLLLRFAYDDASQRSILIDFGSTQLPDGAPSDSLDQIAADIAELTRGHLEIAVASHRHTDHINGFGGACSGRIIADLNPDLVVQPWTDDPALGQSTDDTDPRTRFVRGLADMQTFAAKVQVDRLVRRSRLPDEIGEHLKFLRDTNSMDHNAMAALSGLGKRRQFVTFGDRLDVEELIPGVEIEVLGPPSLEQAPALANHMGPHVQEHSAQAEALFPGAVLPSVPVGVNWLIPKIDRVQAGELLSQLREVDATLNNTSVILSISVGDTTLLFPGDAGIESWGYALFDAPNHEAVLRRLSRTKLHQVGHHGGADSTPKTLWRNFTHRHRHRQQRAAGRTLDRLVTVLSTKTMSTGAGVNAEGGIELPCPALVNALAKESTLVSTAGPGSQQWVDVELTLTT